jgi:hypothetical protein
VSESVALARARTRRRPRKPPIPPGPLPWWVTALLALVNLGCVVLNLLTNWIAFAAFNGFLFCLNGTFAFRDRQWHRYNRWRGGR